MYYKAFIRVIKSLNYNEYANATPNQYASKNVVEERLIEADNKSEVKNYLLEKYPQFFQKGMVYEKETKDQAQFFYVVIYPLMNYEINLIHEGEWTCASCGQVHENKYISRPRKYEKLFGDMLFCRSEDEVCLNNYKREYYKNIELPDDEIYVTKSSPNYIYKITEKATGKCYVGKTRNAPFFRWWNHLTHSHSPFGLILRQSKLSDWTFEVLEILPPDISNTEVLKVESEYILKFNSIKSGFNSVISHKSAILYNGEELVFTDNNE